MTLVSQIRSIGIIFKINLKKFGSLFKSFFIFSIINLALTLLNATIKPGNSNPDIIGYSSPHINNVNHNSAFALVSLNLDVDTSRLKFFVYIPLIIGI